ncbi:MAG: DNA repair protein RecO [Alphaproteobacteria bacterium]|nr:DNA repair protein RecO [Alphaproteobacteria bacterium]
MKLESNGIIIGLRPFEERDMVARIFTRDFGVLAGMMRAAAVAKKNRPLVGQIGAVAWNARLDSHLGTFHFESARNLAAPLMSNAVALLYMNSAFALLIALLPEREKYESLWDDTVTMLQDPTARYVDWEMNLLSSLGYALDLTRCSNCGCADNLTHVSKRTGRAVCETCAAPYLDKCFSLPVDLNATRFFLARAAEEQGVTLPHARTMV